MPLAAQELWAIWEALSFRFKGSRRGVWAAGPSSRLSSSVTRRQAARGKKQEVHKPDKPAQTPLPCKGDQRSSSATNAFTPEAITPGATVPCEQSNPSRGERKGASAHIVSAASSGADGGGRRARNSGASGEQTASADSSEAAPVKEKIKMHKLRASITLRKQRFHVQSISTGTAAPLQKRRTLQLPTAFFDTWPGHLIRACTCTCACSCICASARLFPKHPTCLRNYSGFPPFFFRSQLLLTMFPTH